MLNNKFFNKKQFIKYLNDEKTSTTNKNVLIAINYILNELNLYYSDFDLFGKKAVYECFKELQENKNSDYKIIIYANLGV